jgi:hypothetical protein
MRAGEQQFTIVGVSADFATSQLTTERPQILLPLPDLSTVALAKVDAAAPVTPPPALHLIARGAPGDEPQLKGALENVLRELGVEPAHGEVFSGIVTGQDFVEKSLGDLVSESNRRRCRRRHRAGAGGAGHPRPSSASWWRRENASSR